MNVKRALAYIQGRDIVVTEDNLLNGKKYFCVCDKTNDEAIIVDHISGQRWHVDKMLPPQRRGNAIFAAARLLLVLRERLSSKRNK